MESPTYLQLRENMRHNRRTMLIGLHGIGKTEMTVQLAREFGKTLLYLSTPTVDPWCDLVGLPVVIYNPDGTARKVDFCRREDLNECDMIFFDEINRAHPKSQNAMLEITQFGSINGIPLKKKPLVWAGMNPPNSKMNYSVIELDKALKDRYHTFVHVKANPTLEVYTAKGIKKINAQRAIAWWNGLDDAVKDYVTPRRLEYILESYQLGLDITHCVEPPEMIPSVGDITITALKESLDAPHTEVIEEETFATYSSKWIVSNYDKAVRVASSSDAPGLSESIKKFKSPELNDILHVLKEFPKEFQFTVFEKFSEPLEKKANQVKEKFPALHEWAIATRVLLNNTKNQVSA